MQLLPPRCKQWALAAWCESPPAPQPAAQSIDIALLPSPLLRRGARLLLAGVLAHAVELLLLAQPLGAAVAIGLGLTGFALWVHEAGSNRPRRLLLTAAGRLYLLDAAGRLQQARLGQASLRLGRWLLLELHAGRTCHRLLLGPDVLPASQLCALHRRFGALKAAPATPETPHRRAVSSRPASGASLG